MDENPNTSIKEVERKFSMAVHGIPLIIPLPEESDPILSLMPVSEYKDNPEIDRLYLVDETQDEFCFERDIYEVLWIVTKDSEESTKYTVVVKSLANDSLQEYELDEFLMHELYLLNDDKWLKLKSNIKIPIINENYEK